MERGDLEETVPPSAVTRVAPKLLQAAAGTNEVDQRWASLFQDHLHRVMKSYTSSLLVARSELDKGIGVLRARYDILEIVHECLMERAGTFDAGLAEAMSLLRTATGVMFDAALSTQSARGSRQGRSRSPGRSPKSQHHHHSDVCLVRPVGDKERLLKPPQRPGSGRPEDEDDGDFLGRPPSPHGGSLYGGPSTAYSAACSSRSQIGGSTTWRPSRNYSEIHDPRYERERYEKHTGRPGKDMSVEQLRGLINNFYASKERSNFYRAEVIPRQPLESMEEHLYACLMRRHGDVALVEEWGMAIFTAIQRHAARHKEVAIFGKLLQNRLSESQVMVLGALKETAKKLLQARIADRLPEEEAVDPEGCWREWQQRGVPLAVCESVVAHMYNEEDCERCLQQVRPMAGQPGPSAPELARVNLVQFREVLLEFQMGLAQFFTAEFSGFFEAVLAQDRRRGARGILTFAQASQLANFMADVPAAAEDHERVIARSELEDERNRVLARLQVQKTVCFTECVDDIFAAMIGLRWKALGGMRASNLEKAEQLLGQLGGEEVY